MARGYGSAASPESSRCRLTTGVPGRFIQAGTKEMKAKVSYKEAGIVLSYPWLISFDQTVWVLLP